MNAWIDERLGLCTVKIQISKVKKQFKLLCTKKKKLGVAFLIRQVVEVSREL